jgi:hypothetical protein
MSVQSQEFKEKLAVVTEWVNAANDLEGMKELASLTAVILAGLLSKSLESDPRLPSILVCSLLEGVELSLGEGRAEALNGPRDMRAKAKVAMSLVVSSALGESIRVLKNMESILNSVGKKPL